ncbi:MAG TPA: SCO family protein [Aquabacterium sp.]|nr:SCO family protein [Aquabacterium sp.]
MSKLFSLTRRAMLLAGLAAAVSLAGCDKAGTPAESKAPALKFNSVDITGAAYARKLALTDFDGKPRQLSDFKGKVVFVFFGFTQCPDVCPTTMAELAEVRKRLGADGDRLQGVFVTVDPERDTAQVLKAYLQGMDPSFVGLRGSLAETEAVATEFKVFYQKVPTKSGGYTMDHTAGAFVFDTDGQVRLFSRYGAKVEDLTADIKQLLASAKR